MFSEFHLCELIVLKNIKTQKAVQRQTRLFLISFSENRKKKSLYVSGVRKLQQWNKMQMPRDLKKKEELLTAFQLADSPVALRMGCPPTCGQPTLPNTLKQSVPAALWHCVIIFPCQHSSTSCIQTQVLQPWQWRRSLGLWPFWATKNHNRKSSNC